MSMTVHTITIKRLDTGSQDAFGGVSRAYTTAARGTLDTSRECRAIVMTAKEKLDHGIRSDCTGWKFLVPTTDPSITINDRIEFDYVNGDSRTVKITVPSRARSADAAFWKVIGIEDKSET